VTRCVIRWSQERSRRLPSSTLINVIVLRCTRQLLARLKKLDDLPPVESTTRSATGTATLNDFSFMIGASPSLPAKEQALEEIARFLARTPIMPLDGARPIDLTRKLFE